MSCRLGLLALHLNFLLFGAILCAQNIEFSAPMSLADLLPQSQLAGYKYQSHTCQVWNGNAWEFRMYFTGETSASDVGGDRIRMARSFDGGTSWHVENHFLLSPLGGVSGDRGDDHLLGAPTVIQVGSKFYMLYEGYGKWFVALRNVTVGNDQWTLTERDSEPTTASSTLVGCALAYKSPNTAGVFLVKATHPTSAGPKVNFFITKNVVRPASFQGGWEVQNAGKPLFYAYTFGGLNMKRIRTVWRQHFDTATVIGDYALQNGELEAEEIGYIVGDVAMPAANGATDYALLNRIMLATSNDGISWTRRVGNGPGGCVIEPFNARVATMPTTSTGQILRGYGCGVPIWWVRGDFAEILFTDGTTGPFLPPSPADTQMWYSRIHLADLDSPLAWEQAANVAIRTQIDGLPNVDGNGYSLMDVKWSTRHNRYFAVAPYHNNPSQIAVFLSDENPPAGLPPFFPTALTKIVDPQSPGFLVKDVSLLSESDGNIVSFTSPWVGSAFHFFPSLIPGSHAGAIHQGKVGHVLQFSAP